MARAGAPWHALLGATGHRAAAPDETARCVGLMAGGRRRKWLCELVLYGVRCLMPLGTERQCWMRLAQ